MERIAVMTRNTNETKISMTLNLDGRGKADIHTGIGFFDHMLNSFARHGFFDLELHAQGDLEVDTHHTIEDVGIVLGRAIREAVGDKRGIARYGSKILPMDDSLVLCALDLCGRPWLSFELTLERERVGDLDGALAGHSVNEETIRRIVSSVSIPVEIGGGIRSEEAIFNMLSLGVKRVIIGTKAVEQPEFLRDMAEKFGAEAIVAGIDAKNGNVAVQGWEQISQVTALKLAQRMRDYGIKHIVYTDISRDGMLSGPNVEATKTLTKETGLDVIASGGVSSMEDLQALYEAGIKGAIIGKALYENRIDLAEAVRRLEGRNDYGGV